ncbi:bifunctional DNA-binding transcriptional regulator/O6-methylguanine-DNA methyltransferase Ada [Rouxiella chamberiensis]|uniref:Bifunctional DNA-binding transcriptional regulator/O6-methylguanine-DNA methyltransferase Ada n=1 Tax=Rouxiella chamberiensis TaxID=1513468 RepID=A0ABY7HLT4_9GAMM|nr:bifunctional DNA-binding transcriptional regulator/O6-methylguanine-DNA methyltransferase Ada [Rouxiella chamberiensis]WAT00039.1 bifunctional DNA-binding transcriptional regulator/O6-methylguanine-DNA methyltransferase Ada [Rouxiella chamberiensis]
MKQQPQQAEWSADEARWQAVVNRDDTADGEFVYAVKTTGIYCAPSCPSRQPNRENVVFFENAEQAEAQGYRPCKRCRQGRMSRQHQHTHQVELACRLLENSDKTPTLSQLATEVGLSAYHFHRIFKSLTGLTPRAYAVAKRKQRVRDNLAQTVSVTSALLEAGYASNGNFYASSPASLGMTPSAYRAGGRGMAVWFAVGRCSLGDILVAESPRGICAILLGDNPQALVESLQNSFPHAQLLGNDAEFEQRIAVVVGFVDGEQPALALPLDIRGTAFQQRVWQALRAIPQGETLSYAAVAEKIGSPKAVRAVAGACAANLLAVAIPCHRVVKSSGNISGYRWGVARKKRLLEKERANTASES